MRLPESFPHSRFVIKFWQWNRPIWIVWSVCFNIGPNYLPPLFPQRRLTCMWKVEATNSDKVIHSADLNQVVGHSSNAWSKSSSKMRLFRVLFMGMTKLQYLIKGWETLILFCCWTLIYSETEEDIWLYYNQKQGVKDMESIKYFEEGPMTAEVSNAI